MWKKGDQSETLELAPGGCHNRALSQELWTKTDERDKDKQGGRRYGATGLASGRQVNKPGTYLGGNVAS